MDHEIILSEDYGKKLQNAKPIIVKTHLIQRKGDLGALKTIHTIEEQIIPPLNSIIEFSTLPQYKISDHVGLAALDTTVLPENFNWRDNGGDKASLLSKPENQMLCGSCWAISVAGIVADNHVVSGTVNWKPNLSTTWCLANYPQFQCKGGNPGILLTDISNSGIATNNCVDYSWCTENQLCNGKATAHFKENNVDLSKLIPNAGCYDASVPHYLYYIDPPTTISLTDSNMDPVLFTNTIKKHILLYGPVQGGFLVYKNFMNGAFSKINGGVYLETGIYDNEEITFNKSQLNEENYVGTHAIAIIGWGVQKGIKVSSSSITDVPYWYCRNSWTEKWADGGYFKMAMYPYNKISQFDNIVTIKTQKGNIKAGGIVMLRATKKPEYKMAEQIDSKFLNNLSNPMSYYSNENTPKIDPPKPNPPKTDPPTPNPPTPNPPIPNPPKSDPPKSDPPKSDSSNKKIIKYISIGLGVISSIFLCALVIFLIKKYFFTQTKLVSKSKEILPIKKQVSIPKPTLPIKKEVSIPKPTLPIKKEVSIPKPTLPIKKEVSVPKPTLPIKKEVSVPKTFVKTFTPLPLAKVSVPKTKVSLENLFKM